MKKLLIISILLVGLAVIFSGSQNAKAVPPKLNPLPSDYTNGLTWGKAQKLNKPIAVNFYVDWCHFCKGFAPILDKLSKQYQSKYSFVYINCDDPKNQSLMSSFKVDGYPSFYLFDRKKNLKIKIDSSEYQDIKTLKQHLDMFLK
jgi:thiol-disulfide isomerase/thioredoxin